MSSPAGLPLTRCSFKTVVNGAGRQQTQRLHLLLAGHGHPMRIRVALCPSLGPTSESPPAQVTAREFGTPCALGRRLLRNSVTCASWQQLPSPNETIFLGLKTKNLLSTMLNVLVCVTEFAQ